MSVTSDQKASLKYLKYRPDIDGLRAVAVLSVLAYHTGIKGAPGGYVGVDVFFVISGYLISFIVFSEIAASRFSVIAFYERRIRRIFPALFGMLIVFSALVTLCLFPNELVDYGKSMLAATASVSNFYFWQHSGYFDSPTSNPLLHTWSLAVEEQFYITFPLFLVLIRRFFPQRLRISVVVLFFISLLVSIFVVLYDRSTAYYMPYTRAWELLLGTILSLGMFPRLSAAWQRNLSTLAGIGMIAIAVNFYTLETLFPGFSALLPCLGAALIIGAGESGSSLVRAVLSWRPVVFIGLISYSLYLWHWPVIILFGLGIFVMPGMPGMFAGLISMHNFVRLLDILISILLGILSWRFVERPFRSGPMRLSGRPLFALAGTFMIILMSFSSLVIFTGGFKGRFSKESVQIASYIGTKEVLGPTRAGNCFIQSYQHFQDYDPNQCLHQVDGKNNILLLGDSKSAMLWFALSTSLSEANILEASTVNCMPFIHPSGSPDCNKMMDYIFQSYLPTHPVHEVLLAARWKAKDLGGLMDTIQWAKDHKVPVILVGPELEYEVPLPRLLAYAINQNKPELPGQYRSSEGRELDARLGSLALNVWHVPYISLYSATCKNSSCTEYSDAAHKTPLMFDVGHLSGPGSLLIVQRLRDQGELRVLTDRR
jgi:peptidoglycan/LPS O-acetylase OafA/YrhL